MEEEDNTPYCPECGSENFTAKQPYSDHDGLWKCDDCGHEDREPVYGKEARETVVR